MKEPSLPISLSCQIERKLDPQKRKSPLGGEGGGGLHTTETKWFMIESQRHSYHSVSSFYLMNNN
ncbi:unnamed protein product [Brassica napus]|nr:unnamed protein product [Brassica napus]